MIPIAVSQRVVIDPIHDERRDALDQRWAQFLLRCGLTPVPVPNQLKAAHRLLETVMVEGILLTGGGDLADYGGDTPERDETERLMIQFGRDKRLPVLGVCRGMQMIQTFFGVDLHAVDGHVATLHSICIEGKSAEVNSYHRFAATETVPDLEILAVAADGIVEAVRHRQERIQGVMWHPERAVPFARRDISFFLRFFDTVTDE